MDIIRWPLKGGWSDKQRKDQIVEAYSSLRQQVPYLHSVVLISVLGVALSIGRTEIEYIGPAFLLAGPLIYRLTFWLNSPIQTCPLKMERELVRVSISSFVHSFGFSVWALFLMIANPEQSMTILVFCILASFGASFGMSALPIAAAIPLILIGLPISGLLVMGQDLGRAIAAITFLSAVILVGRILYQQHSMLANLIASRLEVKRERNKAREAEALAIEKSNTDELTKIANRARLIEAIDKITNSNDHQDKSLLLAIIDLDGFKIANDTFGHAAGDAVLIEIATRLRNKYGNSALVSRLGGDEFAVLWPSKKKSSQIAYIAKGLAALIREPIHWNRKNINIEACVGFASNETTKSSTSDLLSQADTALYYAKTSGRGRWKHYDINLLKRDKRLRKIDNLLQSGNFTENVEVEFQPIVELSSGAVVCYEALARCRSDDLGEVKPDEFIVMAEENGVIHKLGLKILEKLISEFQKSSHDTSVSFNLSAYQASESGISEKILYVLESNKFQPQRLKIEITETAFLRDLKTAKVELRALREAGCWIALDDFGSGHASPRYLSDIAFDIVKFDGSLIKNIETSARARALLMGLVQFCHSMGAETVAEHVENRSQHDLVRSMGCDYAQGFYYGRPNRLPDLSFRNGKASLSAT